MHGAPFYALACVILIVGIALPIFASDAVFDVNFSIMEYFVGVIGLTLGFIALGIYTTGKDNSSPKNNEDESVSDWTLYSPHPFDPRSTKP